MKGTVLKEAKARADDSEKQCVCIAEHAHRERVVAPGVVPLQGLHLTQVLLALHRVRVHLQSLQQVRLGLVQVTLPAGRDSAAQCQ